MKKILLPLVAMSLLLFLSSCAKNTEIESESKSDCNSKCETISEMCSGVITYEECSNKCDACDADVFADVLNEDEVDGGIDCDKVKEKMSQYNSPKKESNNCEAACNNYNNRCLTLVPNADQNLFDQGYESCMSECKGWTGEKIGCMEAAQDCPSMTEVCGL